MFEGIVYYLGPLTRWHQTPHEQEYIARFTSRFSWLALARALGVERNLNTDRCGVLLRDCASGKIAVHIEPRDPAMGDLA